MEQIYTIPVNEAFEKSMEDPAAARPRRYCSSISPRAVRDADPPAQKMHPPTPHVPSLLGQENPPSRGIRAIFPPKVRFR